MKRYLILFFAIFTCAFCVEESHADYDDFEDVKEHYTQILLKKWQESAVWQEQIGDPLNFVQNPYRSVRITSYASDTAEKVLNEYYNITDERKNFKRTMSVIREYWLIRYRNLSTKEQIWILISRISGRFLSTYRDTIQTTTNNK
jgi:hypothetical protein